VTDLFYFGPSHFLYGSLSFIERLTPELQGSERQLGLGFITLGLVALAIWVNRRNKFSRLTVLSCLLLLIIPMQIFFEGVSLWRTVNYLVPGAEAIRAPGRVMLVLLLPISCAFSVGFCLIRGYSASIASLLGLFVLLEQFREIPAVDPIPVSSAIQSSAKALKDSSLNCRAFFLTNLGGIHPQWKYQIDAMWISLYAGIPTLNGYSGTSPNGWDLHIANVHSREAERRALSRARSWLKLNNDSGLLLPPPVSSVPLQSVCWLRRGKGLVPRVQVRRLG
jgi:hypothetical protein